MSDGETVISGVAKENDESGGDGDPLFIFYAMMQVLVLQRLTGSPAQRNRHVLAW
jgi:hypothetical protein